MREAFTLARMCCIGFVCHVSHIRRICMRGLHNSVPLCVVSHSVYSHLDIPVCSNGCQDCPQGYEGCLADARQEGRVIAHFAVLSAVYAQCFLYGVQRILLKRTHCPFLGLVCCIFCCFSCCFWVLWAQVGGGSAKIQGWCSIGCALLMSVNCTTLFFIVASCRAP